MAFEQFEKALDSWDKKANQDPSGCYPLIVAKHFWEEVLRLIIKKWMQNPAMSMSELIVWIKQELGE